LRSLWFPKNWWFELIIRKIDRSEIEKVRLIDRGELIENVYYHEDGKLVLKPEIHDVQGWGPGQMDSILPDLYACFDRGGLFWGAFVGKGCHSESIAEESHPSLRPRSAQAIHSVTQDAKMVGIAVLDNQFLGPEKDMLQLQFLHVSRPFRQTGLGKTLFVQAAEMAHSLGAEKLYISATPSENTVHFYQGLGCVVTTQVDPELFALEPEDIHFEYPIPGELP